MCRSIFFRAALIIFSPFSAAETSISQLVACHNKLDQYFLLGAKRFADDLIFVGHTFKGPKDFDLVFDGTTAYKCPYHDSLHANLELGASKKVYTAEYVSQPAGRGIRISKSASTDNNLPTIKCPEFITPESKKRLVDDTMELYKRVMESDTKKAHRPFPDAKDEDEREKDVSARRQAAFSAAKDSCSDLEQFKALKWTEPSANPDSQRQDGKASE